MSELETLQALYEEFVTSFLHPLVAGGVARPARVVPPHALELFASWRPSDAILEGEILAGLHDVAAHVAPLSGAIAFPERGAMALAMAASDLLYITDPESQGLFSRGATPKILGYASELIEQVELPRSRDEALVRHALVTRFLELQRVDTVVHTWAAVHSFFGRQPPRNVTAMPKLRFVRQEKIRRRAVDLVDERRASDLLRALVARSPITALMRHELFGELVFGWASLGVLSDTGIRHGIAVSLAARHAEEHQAARLGRATADFAEAITDEALAGDPGVDPRVAGVSRWYVLALLVEIQIIMALEWTGAMDALIAVDAPAERERPAAGLFYGILPAVADSPFAELLLTMSREDQRAVDDYVAAARAKVPEAYRSLARSFVARVTPPGAPSTPTLESTRDDSGLSSLGATATRSAS